MKEESQPDRQPSKRKKHVALLVLGVGMTLIAESFDIRKPSAYTAGALAFIFLSRPIIYFMILGIVALIVAAIRKSVRRFWFPVLAWLFLATGIFDIVVGGYTNLILRPQIDQGIQELVESGKLDLSQQPEQDLLSRLRGHWASPDDLTHLYFGDQTLIVVNLGQRKDVMYRVTESDPHEKSITFEVSGADYTPHTRTMYFLADGTAWQVLGGAFKSKMKYMGKEETP